MEKVPKRHSNEGLRKICGCARREWPKCSHSWHFNYKRRFGAGYRFSVDVQAGKHIQGRGDAKKLANGWRTEIDEGTFKKRGEVVAPSEPTVDVITLEKFGTIYSERLGKPVSRNHESCFRQLVAFQLNGQPFGQKVLAAITEDEIESFIAHLRAEGYAVSTRNKHIQTCKALFRWATKKGYLTRNPAGDSEALKREKHARRDRRLEPDEEAKLLKHAGPHLQRLIIAALETGCRKGELLSLPWRDVNLDRREMTIRAEKSKTGTARVIPISERLAAVLEMAKTDPTGETFGQDKFVFGDAIGNRITDVKRAWETCVLKAHGDKPAWTRNHSLTVECKAVFDAVNLHFHDLRHEAGSRLLEAGWPIHNVAHMLGHANISQTSDYLTATKVGLQDAMRRLDAARCKPVAIQGQIDQAPLGNERTANAAQSLVN